MKVSLKIDHVLKRPGTSLPPLEPGELRYVVAENGTFLERATGLYTTTCRVDRRVAGLEAHEESCSLHLPLIPAAVSRVMLSFFQSAFELHGGEAALLLLYDPERASFRWLCPDQEVELRESWNGTWRVGGDIRYTGPTALPPGYVLLGDAHSHAEFSAYASSTDLLDEEFKDGFHIIVGWVNRSRVDVHVDFRMDQKRFAISPADVFAEPELQPSTQTPAEWMDRIHIVRKPYTYWWSSRRKTP